MGGGETLVLGIETSCDDTAAALYSTTAGVLAHATASQSRRHAHYGGVVPELAARDHVANLLPLVREVTGARRAALVACTAGPGLAGCLVVGVGLAQALAYAWGVPLARVNHLEGHLLSPFLAPLRGFAFPYLALLVSGGHTAIYDVEGQGAYRQLGTTVDDAVGEAFDKTGILLGLPFPGGPQLAALARRGAADAAPMRPAMVRHPGLDMSFSGLKTMARRRLAEGCRPADIAAAFQQAAVATLAAKVGRALESTGRARLAVVGGVGRNAALRDRLRALARDHGARLFHPPPCWCTDNAAMIALAGATRGAPGYDVAIRPRWPVTELARRAPAG